MEDKNLGAKIYLKAENSKKTCFAEGCSEYAINSHLLQKNIILKRISEKGHLYKVDINPFTLKTRFSKIGINDALTFKGFCSTHDTSIFHPIETKQVDFSNPKSALLLNYRAILNNIRKKQVGVLVGQESRKASIKSFNPLAFERAEGYIKAQQDGIENLIKYKDSLLECLENETNNFYTSSVLLPKLDIAASAVFQLETRSEIISMVNRGFNPNVQTMVFFHAIPLENETRIILSCMDKHLSKTSHLFLEFKEDPIKFCSDILVKRIETWVCSSSIYLKSFKPQERRILHEYVEYPVNGDSDAITSLNIFSKWL
jgi:hypothetical protein